MQTMTREMIEAVLDRVRTWPLERQEEAARLLLELEGEDTAIYHLDDEERADIRAAVEEDARGEVASEEEVQETFRSLRSA